jgi:hypothetical protein
MTQNQYGLQVGTPDIRSLGPIAFGPAGILFLADNASAKVFAIDIGDADVHAGAEPLALDDVDTVVGSLLGCVPGDVLIQGMAVHPVSRNVYLAVQRGRGEDGLPVLVRIKRADVSVEALELEDVPFGEVSIARAPDDDAPLDLTVSGEAVGEPYELKDGRTIHLVRRPGRTATVTELAYVDGNLLVAGLSNEEFSSRLRRIPFPFTDSAADADAGLEIFHVSHGKWETKAPIRTFVPYDGGRSILAGYTCTPVVHIPLDELAEGGKIVGRTVAELGFGNQPLGMATFVADGREHLLVANSSHGLIKIDCADIDGQEPLTEPKGPVGPPRVDKRIPGILRLATLDSEHVLALQTESGRRHLLSLKVDSL